VKIFSVVTNYIPTSGALIYSHTLAR